MPIPVALLLDARKILTRPGVRVSNGNLAAGRYAVGSGVAFLRSLPFELIYHASWFDDDVKFHQQAEVVCPTELPLRGVLRMIGVRSAAKGQTLQAMLVSELGARAQEFVNLIEIDEQTNWFFKRWTFVDRVEPYADHALVTFHACHPPQQFATRWIVTLPDGQTIVDVETTMVIESTTYRLPIRASKTSGPYRLSIYLDGHCAYDNFLHPFDQSVIIEAAGTGQ